MGSRSKTKPASGSRYRSSTRATSRPCSCPELTEALYEQDMRAVICPTPARARPRGQPARAADARHDRRRGSVDPAVGDERGARTALKREPGSPSSSSTRASRSTRASPSGVGRERRRPHREVTLHPARRSGIGASARSPARTGGSATRGGGFRRLPGRRSPSAGLMPEAATLRGSRPTSTVEGRLRSGARS